MLNVAEHTVEGEMGLPVYTNDDPEVRRAEIWLADRIGRGKRMVFSEVVDLTAALARALLARNPNNRNIKVLHVTKLATDIVENAWTFNGESIKLSREGLLNDGQHRCSAVIEAGISIKTMITFGCERESRLTLDQNAVKSPGDYLSMDGVENANHAAAVAALIWQWEHQGRVSNQTIDRPTKAQIRETHSAHSGISDSIHVAQRKNASLVGGVTVLAFCHYVFAQKNRAAADAFIGRLLMGDNLTARDPIYLLRERLRAKKKIQISERACLIFCAWNAHRQNRKMSKLQVMDEILPEAED